MARPLSFLDGRPQPTKPQKKAHYRPFSTLYTESPYIEEPHKVKRASSLGGLHMNLHFKDKAKAAASKKEQPRLLLALVSPHPTPPPPPSSFRSPMEPPRPSTAPGGHRAMKKRSMVSLFSAADSESSAASTSTAKPATVEKSSFIRKSIWAKRHNPRMKLHPYQNSVPYMQAYDPILLESDRHTDLLLQRLSNGSPSFHNYGRKPPGSVLDLGCGPGHWIHFAANIWKSSFFTGFDLVNIILPGLDSMENVKFVQGDFLNYKLPFPSKTFDYIRMANLVLCIPFDKWETLMTEVHRVLAPGGRLEFIDDQIFFPYGNPPPKDLPALPSPFTRAFFDDDDASFDDSDEGTLQGEDGDTESTLFSEDTCSGESRPSSFDSARGRLAESATVRQSMNDYRSQAPPRPPRAMPPPPPSASSSSSSLSHPQSHPPPQTPPAYAFPTHNTRVNEWNHQAFASRDLEAVFEAMLLSPAYNIKPRPSEFVLDVLEKVFGSKKAGKSRSWHIKLAPVGMVDDSVDEERDENSVSSADLRAESPVKGEKKQKQWMVVDWEKQKVKSKGKKEKEVERGLKEDLLLSHSRTNSNSRSNDEHNVLKTQKHGIVSTPLPATLNRKAAERLGLEYDKEKEKATQRAQPPRPKTAPQMGRSVSTPLSNSTPTRTMTPTPITKTSHSQPSHPIQTPVLSAKAAGRLGISYSALAAATDASLRPSPHRPQQNQPRHRHHPQHPGLLIASSSKSTFLPMTPHELEMHACKYVHTLLGCRPALAEYVGQFVDDGERWVGEEEFEEAVWAYEGFRRKRFNWPLEEWEDWDDDSTAVVGGDANATSHGAESASTAVESPMPVLKSKSSKPSASLSRISTASSFAGKSSTEGLVHVRTIRVFEATKSR